MTKAVTVSGVLVLSACWSSLACAALIWLGVPDEKAQVQDTWRMDNICRQHYNRPDSRWASTADYEEMFGSGNRTIKQVNRDFALRAVDTIFTADNRAYDQRTGTLSEQNKYNYAGAIIMKPKGDSVFPARKKEASPLCISGKTLYQTNPRLR